MTSSPPAAPRLALLGCGLLATLALALPGCGEEGSVAEESATARPSTEATNQGGGGAGGGDARPAARATGCPPTLDVLVKQLRGLRRELAVGLSYQQYAAAVEDLRASYAEIPVERLTLDCLAATGTPAEDALNRYIDGANAWGECLADAACTTAAIEPVLQRKWHIASRHLSEAP